SVIEEKTNRVAESLVAAIDPMALLYGKIGAGAVLAAIQMVAWLVAGALAGASLSTGGAAVHGPMLHGDVSHMATALTSLREAVRPMVFPSFLFLLIVGLLQFSTMYAAIGSLVSRPEELGSITSALILPVFLGFVMAFLAIDAPNAPYVVAASFVPLIAPFVMFVRIAVDTPSAWELAACAALNVAFLAFVAFAAGRLYRVGMLLYGRPPTLRQIVTTIRG
ncbi:MAG: ABC transporter permease, partial [Candidatus Eremiobacteraeota bacterium]|nr:ABC transporter permease [Candidatus Eremiobacteraeota bacterium]